MDEKQKEIKTKSASGIWTWIFCLLFASAVILVVISMFGNYIRYVLTGEPDPGLEGEPMGNVIAVPHIRGNVEPIREIDIRRTVDQSTTGDVGASWE